jgi:hypothetical protein
VTYKPIARQRLDKHVPAGANECNSRTSIAWKRVSKHAFLTIGAVFSAWSVQSSYKQEFIWEESIVRSWESSVEEEFIWGSSCQKLSRVLDMAIEGDWEEMTGNEVDCASKACVFEVTVRLL